MASTDEYIRQIKHRYPLALTGEANEERLYNEKYTHHDGSTHRVWRVTFMHISNVLHEIPIAVYFQHKSGLFKQSHTFHLVIDGVVKTPLDPVCIVSEKPIPNGHTLMEAMEHDGITKDDIEYGFSIFKQEHPEKPLFKRLTLLYTKNYESAVYRFDDAKNNNNA